MKFNVWCIPIMRISSNYYNIYLHRFKYYDTYNLYTNQRTYYTRYTVLRYFAVRTYNIYHSGEYTIRTSIYNNIYSYFIKVYGFNRFCREFNVRVISCSVRFVNYTYYGVYRWYDYLKYIIIDNIPLQLCYNKHQQFIPAFGYFLWISNKRGNLYIKDITILGHRRLRWYTFTIVLSNGLILLYRKYKFYLLDMI